MNILITGAATRISRHLAGVLSANHSVTLSDRIPMTGLDDFVQCDLDHDDATNDLVRGMDVIIHSAQVDAGLSVSDQLDGGMRCVYNLARAAHEQGVPRLVFLSSLTVVGKYDEDLAVTERWKPAPTTDGEVLALHLGEFVCREFAREHRIEVVCLRLGDLVWDADSPASSSVLHPDAAAQAVELALTADISEGYADSRNYWGLFHIQSSVGDQRFLTDTAETVLGFRSQLA